MIPLLPHSLATKICEYPKLELRHGTKRLKAVTNYFAMRKINLGKGAQGIMRPMLNNELVFMVGPLDPGRPTKPLCATISR